MRSLMRPVLAALVGMAILSAAHAQFVWTGVGPSDYYDQETPPDDGTANLDFGTALNQRVEFEDSFSANSIALGGGSSYLFYSGDSGTLSLGTGISQLDSLDNVAVFSNNLNLQINGNAVLDAGSGEIIIEGQVVGEGNLHLNSSTGGGIFVFNSQDSGNTYTGTTFLGDGSNPPTVAFYNSTPFSSGTVDILDGAFLIAHGTETLTNDMDVNTASNANPLQFRSWDAPLTLTGDLVFFSATTVDASYTDASLAAPDLSGQIVMPGPIARNPIIFAGPLNASGGPVPLTFAGTGISIVEGASNYTGGTTVQGSLVYGSAAALPASGAIVVDSGGYVGMGDNTAGAFGSLLAKVNTSTSAGAIGFDTLPGNDTQTFSENYSLAGFTSPAVSFGSATSAIVTGTLTPQNLSVYQFGHGGGTLYVDSNLVNLSTTSAVVLNSGGDLQPLTLYLQGDNAYYGGTSVENGFLVFDGASAIPSVGALTAGGSSTSVGQSYIGYTEHTGLTPAPFLALFNKTNTWGIIGFDNAGDAGNIGAIDLTGFNDGVFIGTNTSATLTGAITGTSVTNGNNAANTLRFTATNSGQLYVDTNLADNGSPVAVVVGVPNEPNPAYSSGTVTLNGSNTYTGGTTVNAAFESGPTLLLGDSTSLGTGTLTITGGGIAGLGASSPGVDLPNAIALADVDDAGATLSLVGAYNFTLAGPITGDATTAIQLYNTSLLTVTLQAASPGFAGTVNVLNGTLMLGNNGALGTGTLDFPFGSVGIAEFVGAATAPVLSNLQGLSGNLVLPDAAVLTIDTTADNGLNHGAAFDGRITGVEEGSTSASLVVNNSVGASTNALIELGGQNLYTGGTTVENYALFVLSNNSAAGTGPVTVNTAPAGGLGINSGVTFTNSLDYESGTLAGYGTFSPSNLTFISFGANQTVAPGIPAGYSSHNYPGVLTFTTDVVFDDGGTFAWLLQDNAVPAGASSIAIGGNLSITASVGGFTINLTSLTSAGVVGNAANFNSAVPSSWVLATVGGSVSGFNANQFTFNTAHFESGTLSPSDFSVSLSGENDLMLNFTPVPEPSTYALLAGGLALAAAAGYWRRRPAR
jgi:hypothetical protein